jgi:hypothetical protein
MPLICPLTHLRLLGFSVVTKKQLKSSLEVMFHIGMEGPTAKQPKLWAASSAHTMLLSVPRRGFEPAACFDIWLAAFHIIEQLYDTPFPTEPQNDLPSKEERNAEIRARYEQGETVSELAVEYKLSEQRISQSIHGRRN